MLYDDFSFQLLPHIICILFCWLYFLRGNFLSIRLNFSQSTKLKNSKIIRHQYNSGFINFIQMMLLLLVTTMLLSTNLPDSFMFANQLYLSGSNLSTMWILIILFIFFISILKNSPGNNVIYNNDYLHSITMISLIGPFLLCATSFYSFFFLLELISLLIFYKLSVSSFWVKQNSIFSKKDNLMGKLLTRSWINVMFFQYWVNFFSSVIIIFSLINMISVYGSSDWFFVNLANQLNKNNFSLNDFEYSYIYWIPFFFALFLKIGLAPSHLFKIEVYKGIPFVSIFYYTTVYFVLYFSFVINVLTIYFSSFSNIIWLFLVIFLLIGLFNIISVIFDVSFSKAFFAYSTVINSIGFFILIASSL